ncbi:MAG: M48 family metalloprotease [Deltaproteobacteria bacterium]|nr:M48 family metalloprotease [Deltaproteobacteria bacterium]MBW2359524.1 M48 family metalloprotease [Deltaproteobacteria bacterium]
MWRHLVSITQFGLVLLLAQAIGACIVNPITQRRDVVFVSTEDEVRVGGEAAEQVAEAMGLVDDPRLTALVSGVGQRVAAAAPDPGYAYRFQIVDRVEPNAFALPGGHVFVSRGLLSLTNDEDELANVLAHEIVHIAARHHAQRQARAVGVGLLALPGLVVGGLVGGPLGDIVSAPFALAGGGAIASYSRGQELEADEYGQRLAGQVGYNPAALPAFLRSLERDEHLREESSRQPSWFDSHPATPRRIDDALARVAALAPAQPRTGSRRDYLERLEGLLVGDNPAEGVFDGQRFLHPDLDFTIVFPDGWTTANTRQLVGAFPEDGRAHVALQPQGQSGDPREAANAFLADLSEETRVDVARLDVVEIAGRDAVRGQLLVGTRRGSVAVDATWIAHGGSIYRLMGVVPEDYGAEDRRIFGAVGQSFAALGAGQRASIRERRLRLYQARAGESLEALSRRSGNRWSPAETAVANGVPADAPLSAGQWVKLAIEQPYRSR